VKPITHLHLIQRLIIHRAIPPCPKPSWQGVLLSTEGQGNMTIFSFSEASVSIRLFQKYKHKKTAIQCQPHFSTHGSLYTQIPYYTAFHFNTTPHIPPKTAVKNSGTVSVFECTRGDPNISGIRIFRMNET